MTCDGPLPGWRSGKLRDGKGNLICTRSGRILRWREYFEGLLNVPSGVKQIQMDKIEALVPEPSLDEVPRFEETIAAVGRLKAGRAAGPDGIEAELVSALDPINLRALHEFFVCVWTGVESMPEEWKAAYLVPLPKKGDLTLCKRWRGILLASIPGKVFARINNARLAQYVEDKRILPESQCGFRPGRGTMDMIFSLKLAMEIADYKKHTFHVLFVDLVKAYDSVSRAGLWEVLRRKGIPRKLVCELFRRIILERKPKSVLRGAFRKTLIWLLVWVRGAVLRLCCLTFFFRQLWKRGFVNPEGV